MSDTIMNHEPIWTLVDAAFDGSITPEQGEQLGLLLESDPEACRIYGECASIEADLHLLIRTRNASQKSCGQIAAEAATLEDEIAGPCPASTHTPVLGFLADAYHGTIGFFSQDLPFSLLVATVVTAVGLWIGSLIAITHHVQIARKPSSPSTVPHALDSSVKFIGHITGIVDVKWADPQTATVYGANVALGRKYALASGLLEITYDAGARVLLQGPATYEIDSPEGGYLSVGRLTAKLEKKGSGIRRQGAEEVASGQWSVASKEGSGFRVQDTNHKSEIINHKFPAPRPQSAVPTFVVRTPTATVTDLGTEFGVDVDFSGRADVHVFVGMVACRSTVQKNRSDVAVESLCLSKDMAARFMPNGAVVKGEKANRHAFAQFHSVRPTRRAFALVGFYPLDGNAKDHSGRNHDVATENVQGVTFVDGKEGKAAHFDKATNSFIDLPIDARPTVMPKLTWGAWVRPRTLGPDYAEILSTDISGYGRTLTIDDRAGETTPTPSRLRFAAFLGSEGTDRGVLPSTGPLPRVGEWTFVAGTYDDIDHRVGLFVEDKALHGGRGGMVEDRMIGTHFSPAREHIRVGSHGGGIQPFDGDIDNVFVFREILNIEELEFIRNYGAAAIAALAKGELLPEERRETENRQ